MLGRLIARNDEERAAILDAGFDWIGYSPPPSWFPVTTCSLPQRVSPTDHCCGACDSRATAS